MLSTFINAMHEGYEIEILKFYRVCKVFLYFFSVFYFNSLSYPIIYWIIVTDGTLTCKKHFCVVVCPGCVRIISLMAL